MPLGKPIKGKMIRGKSKSMAEFMSKLQALTSRPNCEGITVVLRWQNPRKWQWTSHHYNMVEDDFHIAVKLIKAIKP